MTRFPIFLAAMFCAGTLAAFAGELTPVRGPSLRAEATIAGPIVRIGDLVENAGAAADIAIFRAPDLGETGTVPTAQVLDAIRPHGLPRVETHGLAEIAVTRATRQIGRKELEERIAAAVATQYRLGPAESLSVAFDWATPTILADPAAAEPRIARASYDRYSGRFDVAFEVPDTRGATRQLRFTGTIAETVEVAVPLRPLGRGDVIRAEDVAIERQPKAYARPNALTSLAQVVGLAARRPLRAGQVLTAADVMRPELVTKNEAVTIVYEAPGMMLSVRGKAMESGAEGDVVTVFNAQTKRTLQGVVAGPGRVALITASGQPSAPDVTGTVAARTPSSRAE